VYRIFTIEGSLTMTVNMNLPVAIIGAGPVGLAAAVQVRKRGMTPLVLEGGPATGHNIRSWGHIRVFSPWKYNIDDSAAELLAETAWTMPDPEHFPTGSEIVEQYLEPLAEHPALAPHIRFDSRVTAITRVERDKMKNADRSTSPFLLRVRSSDGTESSVVASAVIDSSGTVDTPNPIGSGGIPAIGETELASRIAYRVPDVLNTEREHYAGKRVLVVGSGDSAFNALLNLLTLKEEEPSTEIFWVVRRPLEQIQFGGGENDALRERGALGMRVKAIVERGQVSLIPNFRITELTQTTEGIVLRSGDDVTPPVDEIIAVTGYRPNLEMLREVRLNLDAAVESPSALAPLIDPNVHSCGTVRPHGAVELTQPEENFYIAGMKSYGRAPTFLMLTGYEQVRSIAAALVGDWESAKNVQLELPETGVCSVGNPGLSLVTASVGGSEDEGDCCAPACCS
jgi:thioredoxin reductase